MLTIRQLSRSFREGSRVHQVLDRLDAEVRPAERVAIMGRSGSGKSTLLNLISGIDRADSGTVEIDGVEVSSLGEPGRTLYRRAHIGFVYQFFNLIPTLDVAENVRLVLELNGVGARAAAARARAALAAVGLGARVASAVDQLSGGEQQRVAIARAIVNHPDLLLADEPTGALDTATRDVILALFAGLNHTGLTVVLVTHDSEVAAHAQRIIRLRDGTIVADSAAAITQPFEIASEAVR